MSHILDGKGKLNTFKDIHGVVDGKLYKYNIKTFYTNNYKSSLITQLLEMIHNYGNKDIKQYGIDGVKLIQNNIGNNSNYSGADNIYAEDILIEIYELIKDEKDKEIINTAINHICEQMSDMLRTHGTCPTGRVGRLFQIFMFLKDYYK